MKNSMQKIFLQFSFLVGVGVSLSPLWANAEEVAQGELMYVVLNVTELGSLSPTQTKPQISETKIYGTFLNSDRKKIAFFLCEALKNDSDYSDSNVVHTYSTHGREETNYYFKDFQECFTILSVMKRATSQNKPIALLLLNEETKKVVLPFQYLFLDERLQTK